MPSIEHDTRTEARRALDEQIAAETHYPISEFPVGTVFRPVVGVSTNHTCVSIQTNVAYARVFGGDTNHGAKKTELHLGEAEKFLLFYLPFCRYVFQLYPFLHYF